jgi:hypothetical protein
MLFLFVNGIQHSRLHKDTWSRNIMIGVFVKSSPVIIYDFVLHETPFHATQTD